MCKIDSEWEAAEYHRECISVLCDDLEGWYGLGRREVQEEGSYVYRWLVHFLVQQKHNIIKQLHSNSKKQKHLSHI